MKQTTLENWRVEIDPDFFRLNTGDNDGRRSYCHDIVKQVERHIDGIDAVSVKFDRVSVCSHCGEPWGEKSDSYNGGCCDKDEENRAT